MLIQAQAHFYKHLLKLVGNSGEWEWIIAYPLVHIFSIGFLVTFVRELGVESSAVVFMLVGTFAWNFYVLSQRGITYGILPEIWSDSAKHQIISSATAVHFILGNGAYGLFSASLSVLLMHLVAITFFSFDIFAAGPVLILGLLGLLLYGIAEGLFINAVMVL